MDTGLRYEFENVLSVAAYLVSLAAAKETRAADATQQLTSRERLALRSEASGIRSAADVIRRVVFADS